jgi:hypothetical protein
MPTTMINVHVAWVGSGRQCVRQQDERLPRIGLDNATDTKAAFGRWYNALLETNKQVQKEESQNLKEMMNRIWYMRSIHGDDSDPGLREFHFNAWFISSGKCFFATTNAIMGTCQGKISKGDVMVVVAGLSMPLILTPFGNLFHLVGHAYSHGIMNGEA